MYLYTVVPKYKIYVEQIIFDNPPTHPPYQNTYLSSLLFLSYILDLEGYYIQQLTQYKLIQSNAVRITNLINH